ncbi:MAG: hypothetical protein JSV56_13265 [Methanomassiliicoccales archaeon]|nr:MAG: hypothetical protein JSV56_13265 [Methanomassiliicoccales archaeon]
MHTMKSYDYVNERGGIVTLKEIAAPQKGAESSENTLNLGLRVEGKRC